MLAKSFLSLSFFLGWILVLNFMFDGLFAVLLHCTWAALTFADIFNNAILALLLKNLH